MPCDQGDDCGYQTSHPGIPLPVDMSTSEKSSAARRGRLIRFLLMPHDQGDDSGYQTSHPGSPLPVDMSTSGKSSVTRRGRLDSAGAFPPASPAPSQSSQGPFSPGSGPSTRPFRAGSHTLRYETMWMLKAAHMCKLLKPHSWCFFIAVKVAALLEQLL